MARQARLSVPQVMHYLLQRGHNGGAIVHDAEDLEHLLQVLREAALSAGVRLHAYAVASAELRLLATPDSAAGASRMMQTLGRRYAAWFNRRHGRSGALWDGRFRSALIEAGAPALLALRHVDGAADADGAVLPRTSAAQRVGGRRDVALVDPPGYWALGNTPFDRESRYRALLAEPVPAAQAQELESALQGGWALGSPAFLAALAAETARPLQPRPRGRPRRAS